MQRSEYGDNPTSADLFDQFYTKRRIARFCFGVFCEHYDPYHFLMIEPSAGNGSFYNLLPPGSLGYDAEPKCDGVVEADFFTVPIVRTRPIAVIGNPPFGQKSSLAIRFVNHAAGFAEVVGFILPRTFRKAWIHKRLNSNLHLVREEVLPDDAFVFKGKSHSVPTVFQIWERRPTPRNRPRRETTHQDFEFLETSEGADFVVQRIGARAGRIRDNFPASPSSHHFLRSNADARRNVRAVMWQLDFDSVSGNVAGQPSLSMSEIVALYNQFVVIEELSGAPPSYCCSPIYAERGALCTF